MADPFQQMSFAKLRDLRDQIPDPIAQRFLAPYEHQAFARLYAQDHPYLGLSMLAAIPGYQAAKLLGLLQSRSGAQDSLQQMAGGYRGLAQGYGGLLGLIGKQP